MYSSSGGGAGGGGGSSSSTCWPTMELANVMNRPADII